MNLWEDYLNVTRCILFPNEKQKSVYLSPWMLHAFLAIYDTLLHVLFSIFIVWSLINV